MRGSFDALIHLGDGKYVRPGDHDPWCPRAQYWVLRSISGRFYSTRPKVEDPPLELDDLEILEHLDADHCWEGRIVTWHFNP